MKHQAKRSAFGSKFFNFRLFLEAVKRLRVIGVAVAILALTASFLIPSVIWISQENAYRHWGEYEMVVLETSESGEVLDYEEVWVPREITPEPVDVYFLCLPLYLLPFLAPLFFFVLFSFLHKRKQSDFFHAIPYTRTCVYVSFVTAALSFVFVIQIASALVSAFLYAICPFTTFEFGELLQMTSLSMLSAAFLSSFAMLSLSVTGTGATSLLLFGLFASITRIVLFLFSLAVEDINIVGSAFYPFLSIYWYLPIRMFMHPGDFYFDEAIPAYGELVPYTIIVTMLIFAAAGLLYKHRRSEMAERSAPSRLLQSIFRCLFTLPFALIIMTIILVDEIEIELLLILFALTLVVFYLYELITTKRMRNLLRATPWLGVVTAGAIVFASVYIVFFFSVHRAIPENRIDSVSVQTEGSGTFESINTANVLTEDDRVITLVSDALTYTRDYHLKNSDSLYAQEDEYYDVTIKQKNGITVKRRLRFTKDSQEKLALYLSESQEYQDTYLELPPLESATSLNFYAQGSYHHFYGYYDARSDASQLEEFWTTFCEEYNTLSKEEQRALKDYAFRSGDKEESIETFPEDSLISSDLYSLFYVEVSINGVYNGYRYNSDYAIPLSMTKTLTKLFEESQESSYAEFYSGTYLDPTTEKPIYIDSENGSSVDAITEAVFDCLATGELSFDSGEIHLCRYMEYDLTMSLASHEEDYVRFFTLISDYLETKRDATRENTVPVLIGIDMYSEGGSEARANAYSVMYLTEEEYDALLVAVYLKPAH